MAEDPRCCELAHLVYDCPGPCRRRVYEDLRGVPRRRAGNLPFPDGARRPPMSRPRLATGAAPPPPASAVVQIGSRPSSAQRSRCRRREAVCHGPRPAGGIGGRHGRGLDGRLESQPSAHPFLTSRAEGATPADSGRPPNDACLRALTRRGSDGAEGGGGLPPCLPPVSSSARLCHGPLCASSEARRGSQRPPEVPCLPATHGGPQNDPHASVSRALARNGRF